MTGVTVREARADDGEKFVRAYELAWDATLAPIAGRTLAELSPFEERLASFRSGLEQAPPGFATFVAECGGDIVGVAVVSDSPDAGELRALYVVPDAWGSGVATVLLERALDFMRSQGRATALLWVVADNARARRFYEREGWRADGEEKPSGVGPPELRYTRAL